ncbi:MAG: hypothetical protein ABI182_03170 [Candidatus Baltobacteraceae bacterium]
MFNARRRRMVWPLKPAFMSAMLSICALGIAHSLTEGPKQALANWGSMGMFWLTKKRTIVVGFVLVVSGCVGSWAQQTDVPLLAMGSSAVHGEADVSIAVSCTRRCEAGNGSDILLSLEGTKETDAYEIVLANGSCRHFNADGVVVASGDGHSMHGHGVLAHVATPIHALTTEDYLLVVRGKGQRRAIACGKIRNDTAF